MSPAGERYNRAVSGAATTEHELIRRARAGDEGAFAELVTMHAGRVYGALRRFGLASSEADEVAQEVFVRAWRGLPRFEGRAQFSTWLYRIAFNEAQRRRSRREPLRAESDPDRDDPVVSLPEPPHLGPEAQTLEHEFERTLDRALGELPASGVTPSFYGTSRASRRDRQPRSWAFARRRSRAGCIVGACSCAALLEPYLQLEEG